MSGGAAPTLGCSEYDALPGAEVLDVYSCLLVCRVTWQTDEPASSWVEFGPAQGGRRLRVGSDGETRDHDVLVVGMHAGTEHELQAVSTRRDGWEARSELLPFTTGYVPFETAEFDPVGGDPDRMQPGWTLVNLVVGNAYPPAVVMMIDEQAEPVWYHSFGAAEGFSGIQASGVGGDEVLIGGNVPPGHRPRRVDLAGEILWEGPAQPDEPAQEGSMHHVFEQLPNGNYLGMRFEFADASLDDVVFEIDGELDTVWEWHVADHIPESDEHFLHGNMAQVDLQEDAAYYHARNLSSMYKLDRASGELVWELGEGRDFEMLGDHPDPWFVRGHAPEILADGNLLVHDNGSSVYRPYTRIMEYELDQDARTIRPVWQYPPDGVEDAWFSSVWGDADRLANGNTLFASGSVFEGDATGRLVEVTPSGEVVWRVEMRSKAGGPAGTYMVERIPPLAAGLP